ncbi:MAG: toll/interleukin-1 receptor domain-containing protein [Anaerolineae bacterium]|nr:toll/interleukin-1 receptor domain-containing protein [Anaerolineae bacterium]
MADNDVFISYRRKDSEFVQQLHQELTKRGLSAWFDRESIEVADHWRTSIAEGIRDCKVFVLVLSPDAVESVNIRKEVDLAESHGKRIIPLLWRQTEIPVAFEYALAGIQWIDFKETASPENFDQLADVIKRLIGGATMDEAAKGKEVATESPIPPLPQAETVTPAPGKLIGLKKKPTVSPMALGGAIISSVVTTFGLDVETQDLVNKELKWLFSASDLFLKIRRGEAARTQAVSTPIPETAQQTNATNQLPSTLDDFDLQIWEGQIESGFKRIDTYLKNLKILLDQEAFKGEAGKADVYLQNQIKASRVEIVKILQEMAQLMNQAYGILITSPNELYDFLK